MSDSAGAGTLGGISVRHERGELVHGPPPYCKGSGGKSANFKNWSESMTKQDLLSSANASFLELGEVCQGTPVAEEVRIDRAVFCIILRHAIFCMES